MQLSPQPVIFLLNQLPLRIKVQALLLDLCHKTETAWTLCGELQEPSLEVAESQMVRSYVQLEGVGQATSPSPQEEGRGA